VDTSVHDGDGEAGLAPENEGRMERTLGTLACSYFLSASGLGGIEIASILCLVATLLDL
jgi:hypothetical protein